MLNPYDQKLLVRNPRPSTQTFSQILKSSIEKEQTSRGWCSRCQRYQSLATRKATHDIPAVLILNAAINSPEAKQFWSIPGWLPEEIGIIIDGGAFYCYQGDDLKSLIQRRSQAIAVYSLIGIAADIDSGQNQKSHLVSLINGMSYAGFKYLTRRHTNEASRALPPSSTSPKPMASIQ